MTTEKLFSYGTLQYDNVQLETFGRKLTGQKDTLVGYELSVSIQITDPAIIKLSGESVHKTLHYSGKPEHLISGVVFDVTREELTLADGYETDYKRVLVTLQSGTKAWIYIGRSEKLKQPIEVVSYDLNWPELFKQEAAKIKSIFSDNFIKIYHIGSTAVPGLAAKPTIDILLEVKNINLADHCNSKMAELGYEAWGEYSIPDRRFFVKGKEKRTHHVHVFQTGNPEIKRHIDFRDYLITHPESAKKYEELKIDLAQKFAGNRRAYVEGKQEFINLITLHAPLYSPLEEKLKPHPPSG